MRIDLTSKDIMDIFSNNERVGMGSNGIVFKYDDDSLFKFKYKEFIDCFPVVDGSFDFSSIADISEEVKSRKSVQNILTRGEEPMADLEIKSLMSKQRWLRKSTMPQGMVYVDGYCVGYILKHHKNMVNLYRTEMEEIREKLSLILDKHISSKNVYNDVLNEITNFDIEEKKEKR